MAFKKRNKVPQWNVDIVNDITLIGQRTSAIASLKKAKKLEESRLLSGEYEWVNIDRGMKLVRKDRDGK